MNHDCDVGFKDVSICYEHKITILNEITSLYMCQQTTINNDAHLTYNFNEFIEQCL